MPADIGRRRRRERASRRAIDRSSLIVATDDAAVPVELDCAVVGVEHGRPGRPNTGQLECRPACPCVGFTTTHPSKRGHDAGGGSARNRGVTRSRVRLPRRRRHDERDDHTDGARCASTRQPIQRPHRMRFLPLAPSRIEPPPKVLGPSAARQGRSVGCGQLGLSRLHLGGGARRTRHGPTVRQRGRAASMARTLSSRRAWRGSPLNSAARNASAHS